VIESTVRSEEVIVSNEEGSKSNSTVFRIESTGSSGMEIIGTDEPFN